MTTIDLAPWLTASPEPWRSSISLIVKATPWRGNAPAVRGTGDDVIFPAMLRLALSPSAPTFVLEPTDGTWCWRIQLDPAGAGLQPTPPRYVTLAASSDPISWGDLVDVDPATFAPTPDVIAGWDAALLRMVVGGEIRGTDLWLIREDGSDFDAGTVSSGGGGGIATVVGRAGLDGITTTGVYIYKTDALATDFPEVTFPPALSGAASQAAEFVAITTLSLDTFGNHRYVTQIQVNPNVSQPGYFLRVLNVEGALSTLVNLIAPPDTSWMKVSAALIDEWHDPVTKVNHNGVFQLDRFNPPTDIGDLSIVSPDGTNRTGSVAHLLANGPAATGFSYRGTSYPAGIYLVTVDYDSTAPDLTQIG